MHIYLVQHGAAVPKDENEERPLSDQGRDDINKVASFLARSGVSVPRVIHSGKLRAMETALLLSGVIGPGNMVEEAETGLAPDDSTDVFFAAIEEWTDDAIIVGHLPFVAKLASRLVTGNEEETVIHFKPGSVACLERGENGGGWTVSWFVRPELFGG
jgi:phosphohistidine phosphatase